MPQATSAAAALTASTKGFDSSASLQQNGITGEMAAAGSDRLDFADSPGNDGSPSTSGAPGIHSGSHTERLVSSAALGRLQGEGPTRGERVPQETRRSRRSC